MKYTQAEIADLNTYWPKRRVEIDPITDRWKGGDKHGTVASINRSGLAVILMDKSGDTITHARKDLQFRNIVGDGDARRI